MGGVYEGSDEFLSRQVDPRRSDEPSESLLTAGLSCAAVSLDLMSPMDESVSDGASPANDAQDEPDPWAVTELKDSSPKWNGRYTNCTTFVSSSTRFLFATVVSFLVV